MHSEGAFAQKRKKEETKNREKKHSPTIPASLFTQLQLLYQIHSLSLSNHFLLSLSIAGAWCWCKYLRGGRERERKKSREEPFLLCLKKLDWEMLFAFDDGHPFQGKQEKLKSIYW